MLSVATFNQRAINVYRKAGFEDAEVFLHETNSGQHDFLRMTLVVSRLFLISSVYLCQVR
jgi:ribosomal-protein-alanine N-acetyltransferase